jgi:Tol biopolymer transport system component
LAIAPDGKSIVFEHLTKHSHFVVGLMRANGALDHYLGPGGDPAFSPNGNRIVFTRREMVYTMNRHGHDLRRVTPHSWNTADPDWAVRTGR